MSQFKIIGENLPNIPWQEKPAGCKEVIWRYDANPVIDRNPIPRAGRVFNSSVLPYGDGFVGVFRADHRDGMPRLHIGYSKDGLKWDIEENFIHWFDEDGKPYDSSYSYDPRLILIDGTYYIVWCTNMSGPVLGLGKTTDFKHFTRLENPFFPFNRNGVLFPRKINGQYLMLSRPSDNGHTPFGDIFVSESPDLVHWGRHRRVMGSGGNWWQGVKIGAGAVPIETSEGWLLFYHGVESTCNGFVYSFGAAVLDLENPSKVLMRSKEYLLTPEEDYEVNGYVPNVCFPCAALCDAATGRIAIYYGAADTFLAAAFTTIDEIMGYLKNNSLLFPGDDIAEK